MKFPGAALQGGYLPGERKGEEGFSRACAELTKDAEMPLAKGGCTASLEAKLNTIVLRVVYRKLI